MSDGLEYLAIGAVVVGLVAGSVYVTHRMDASTLADYKTSVANVESERNKALVSQYASALLARSNAEKQLATVQSTQSQVIADAKATQDKLDKCLRTGTCGLRIRTVATQSNSAAPIGVSSTSGASGPDVGTYSRLDGASESAYSALRAGIVKAQAMLQTCHAYVNQLQGSN